MPDDEHLLDPDAPPSEQELAEAERLREALDDPSREHANAQLARALSAAWSPRDLAPEAHRALVDQALARSSQRRRRVVVRVAFGASAVLALAACVLLFVRGGKGPAADARAAATPAVSRSTQALFPEHFPPTGGESARIDRIAVARAADLRENEFAKWGVR
jgi:ferric-dicitrate binding protein FerR (iron transport regulator)